MKNIISKHKIQKEDAYFLCPSILNEMPERANAARSLGGALAISVKAT